MPNWCHNNISFTFAAPILKDRFLDKFYGFGAEYSDDSHMYNLLNKQTKIVERKTYCFNSLFPVPEEISKRGYDKAGYYWQSNNWGTKWDIYLSKDDIYQTDKQVSFSTDTAWGPPVGFLEKITEQFPDMAIDATYDEPGVGFAGKFAYDPITRQTTDVTHEYGDKAYYDLLAEEYENLEEYFWIDNEDQVVCGCCGAIINKRIYDAYSGKCYTCNEIILLNVAQRTIVERVQL